MEQPRATWLAIEVKINNEEPKSQPLIMEAMVKGARDGGAGEVPDLVAALARAQAMARVGTRVLVLEARAGDSLA